MIRMEWIQHVIEHLVREVIQTEVGCVAGHGSKRWRQIPPGRAFARRRNRTQRVLRPFVRGMKVKYFQDTDTLYIEFRAGSIVETKDLDENTQLDVDAEGNICALTVEHARERADLQHFSLEQVGT